MSDANKRDEWEQHNRDEANARAAQQEAAGPMHRPVPTEPYARLSGSAEARIADLDVGALIDAYERATNAERVAWLAARDLIPDENGIGAWNAWRDAVERTQQAARSLVNYDTARFERK